jgi:hypothetical protein
MTLRDQWKMKRESLDEDERIEQLAALAQDLIGTDREDELTDLLFNEDWNEIGLALHQIGYIDDEDLTG